MAGICAKAVINNVLIRQDDHLCFAYSNLLGYNCVMPVKWSFIFSGTSPLAYHDSVTLHFLACQSELVTSLMVRQQPPSKRSAKSSSKELRSREKVTLDTASCDSQLGLLISQLLLASGDCAQMTNEKLNILTTLLSGYMEKCSANKLTASPDFWSFHDFSTPYELPEDGTDLLDGLDFFFFFFTW